jgi:hypothetical protein
MSAKMLLPAEVVPIGAVGWVPLMGSTARGVVFLHGPRCLPGRDAGGSGGVSRALGQRRGVSRLRYGSRLWAG